MRLRSFRAVVWGPVAFAVTAGLAFVAAPVQAGTEPNRAWGDIDSVVAGPGLSGGATQGDAVLAVLFGGNGSANTVARSDHNHDGFYAPLNHSHEFPSHNHDGVYAPIDITFDDRYSQLGHDHDGRYLGLGGGTLNGLLTLAIGDLTLLGDGARVVAPQLVSTAAQGTAPLQVTSDTRVQNLNADKLDGFDAADFALAGSGGVCDDCALLSGSNAFTGVNTFNAGTTFGAPVGLSNGGATFTLQSLFTSPSAYSLRLIDSGANVTRLVIDQSGRVGIGTTMPSSPLHVVGDIRASGLNLGSAFLGPTSLDMASSTNRTFSITNSNGGIGHLAVEGNVTAAGYAVQTGGGAATAGFDAIPSSDTARLVSSTAVTGTSLVFVTPDASRSGCVVAPGYMYVSARSAGASFTVTVAGAAPAAGESYCFNWWVLN